MSGQWEDKGKSGWWERMHVLSERPLEAFAVV